MLGKSLKFSVQTKGRIEQVEYKINKPLSPNNFKWLLCAINHYTTYLGEEECFGEVSVILHLEQGNAQSLYKTTKLKEK